MNEAKGKVSKHMVSQVETFHHVRGPGESLPKPGGVDQEWPVNGHSGQRLQPCGRGGGVLGGPEECRMLKGCVEALWKGSFSSTCPWSCPLSDCLFLQDFFCK